MTTTGTVVIIGAGVLGLSAAVRIQEMLTGSSTTVTVVARDIPGDESLNYATPWAGAHYRPCPGSTESLSQEAAWAEQTYREFDSLAKGERLVAGIEFLQGEEFFQNPSPEYLKVATNVDQTVYAHLKDSFIVVRPEDISDLSIRLGFSYRTYCVNTPVYTAYLLRRFVHRGGVIKRYILAAVEEAFHLNENVTAVVNCSGTGIGDEGCLIIRGQTCLVRDPIKKTITRQNADGSWSFAIPRPLDGGTIIGGTKQVNDWNPNVSLRIRAKLLGEAARWFPFEPNRPRDFNVIRDIVGRRPARKGGLRLGVERMKITVGGNDQSERPVVHAYGAGGRGVELSWGIAGSVVQLLAAELGISRNRLLSRL